MRIATDNDFKPGTVLMDASRNEFTLLELAYPNDKDMWIGRGERGSKIIFKSEAKYYNIKGN